MASNLVSVFPIRTSADTRAIFFGLVGTEEKPLHGPYRSNPPLSAPQHEPSSLLSSLWCRCTIPAIKIRLVGRHQKSRGSGNAALGGHFKEERERREKPKTASISEDGGQSRALLPADLGGLLDVDVFLAGVRHVDRVSASDGKSDSTLIIAARGRMPRTASAYGVIFSRQTRGTCGLMDFEQCEMWPKIKEDHAAPHGNKSDATNPAQRTLLEITRHVPLCSKLFIYSDAQP